VTPDVSSYTWIVALSALIRMTSDVGRQIGGKGKKKRGRTSDELVVSDSDL
jgi:hypothetical protein